MRNKQPIKLTKSSLHNVILETLNHIADIINNEDEIRDAINPKFGEQPFFAYDFSCDPIRTINIFFPIELKNPPYIKHKRIPWRSIHPKVTFDDYYISTTADFSIVAYGDKSSRKWRELCQKYGHIYYYCSESGSQYTYDDKTHNLYRYSDHWGEVASCKWTLDGKRDYEEAIGVANLRDFKPNNNYWVVNPEIHSLISWCKDTKKAILVLLNNYEMTDEAYDLMREYASKLDAKQRGWVEFWSDNK